MPATRPLRPGERPPPGSGRSVSIDATELLAELRHRGVTLVPAGDRLRYFPASGLTAVLREGLRAHKAELLRL